MDDRTRTDFHKTLPLDLPAPASKAVPKKRRRLVLLLAAASPRAGVGYWILHATGAATRAAAGPRRIAATTPGRRRRRRGRRHRRHLECARHRDLARHRHHPRPDQRLAHQASPITEGQIVKKGDLLAEIDSRPYELALAQAQGALERDKALLRGRAARSQALPGPREDQRDPAPAARHPGLAGAAVPGQHHLRPGADRHRQAQHRLLPYRGAGQRPGRAAPRRPGQLRDRRAMRTASSSSPSCSRSA